MLDSKVRYLYVICNLSLLFRIKNKKRQIQQYWETGDFGIITDKKRHMKTFCASDKLVRRSHVTISVEPGVILSIFKFIYKYTCRQTFPTGNAMLAKSCFTDVLFYIYLP